MPTYEYECKECAVKREVLSDSTVKDSPLECKKCGGRMQRIFSPPAIIQTGYKPTDARYGRGKG